MVVTKSKKESEAWLRNFLETADGPSYEDAIEAITNGRTKNMDKDDDYCGVSFRDGYLTCHGHDAHGAIPPEFWDHIEVVTGQKINNRSDYFSCSC